MSALDKVAELVRKHREELHEEGICICGWHADRETDYPAHLTQVLSPWVRADGGDQ